jgi:hypothetical protein
MPHTTNHSAPSAGGTSLDPRREVVLHVPLAKLFDPESDPSVRFPDHSAEVEGFAVTPEGITVALAVSGPHAAILADEVWSGLERRGQAIRRTAPHDERGRALLVMTVRAPIAPELLDLVRHTLLLPVEARRGVAELHLALAAGEAEEIRRALATIGIDASVQPTPPARETAVTEVLSPEDWGFLGLLCALHVFDGPTAVDATTIAGRLGIDPGVFERKVHEVEVGMEALVAGLFEVPDGGAGLGVAG